MLDIKIKVNELKQQALEEIVKGRGHVIENWGLRISNARLAPSEEIAVGGWFDGGLVIKVIPTEGDPDYAHVNLAKPSTRTMHELDKLLKEERYEAEAETRRAISDRTRT